MAQIEPCYPAFRTFKNLKEINQSGVDEIIALKRIQQESFNEIKEDIINACNLTDEIITNEDFSSIDSDLISDLSEKLENNYFVFSELIIQDFLQINEDK